MKLYILNGPNLNFLGIREPAHYGSTTYAQLLEMIETHCEEKESRRFAANPITREPWWIGSKRRICRGRTES